MTQRIIVLVQIAGNHGKPNSGHSREAVKKLTLSALGFALGLAERQDPDSIMRPGADDPKTLPQKPSPDDVLLLKHLWANLGLKVCEFLVESKKVEEAIRAAELIPPGLPQAKEAQELLRDKQTVRNRGQLKTAYLRSPAQCSFYYLR